MSKEIKIGIEVLKKDCKFKENYNPEKIKKAVSLSAKRLDLELSNERLNDIEQYVYNEILKLSFSSNSIKVRVEDLHVLVKNALQKYEPLVYEQYSSYVDYKQRFNKCFASIATSSKRIIYNGDKENANKNSSLISTKKELLSGLVSKELMLEFELPSHIVDAHNKGWIYLHDLGDLFLGSYNCAIIDVANIMKDGFELNGIYIDEPKTIESACNILCDIILCGSSQQFGGYSIESLDSVLAKYVRKSFIKETEFYKSIGLTGKKLSNTVDKIVEEKLYQGIQTIEYKINCVNNACGQTAFVSIGFGLDTTKEGRMVSKSILNVRMNKLGKSKLTAIFPKLIFFHRSDVNGDKDSPNYDIKKLAIKCSMENQYPDYLDCDHGYVGGIYERTGKALMLMGCRAHLSPWFNENGIETYTGRFNIAACTLNFVKIAIESEGDINKYKELICRYSEIILEFLLYRYEKLSKIQAKTNPLMFCEGGACMKLKPEETLDKILESATASFGYIGLAEASYLMTGKKLSEDNSFALEILSFYKELINDACKQHGKLFALYGTPAESLCMKFLEKDKETYGVIEGVTDKAWYSNSFHVDCRDKITAIEKIKIEKPLFDLSTGGRIFYSEWPHMENEEAVEQYINICMKNGLYMGVNFENCTCMDCGETKFDSKVCPKCGSKNLTIIDRVSGYLGLKQVNGDTRYNNGKVNEVNNRVKHYNVIKEVE